MCNKALIYNDIGENIVPLCHRYVLFVCGTR